MSGFDDLAKTFGNMENALSDKELASIVKDAAGPVRSAIRSAAPRGKTGMLERGIILHKEKHRYQGKVVYDVYMDPEMNDVFQKPIQNPVRSRVPYAYYPASQEHGFFTRRPGGGMIYTRADGSAAKINKVPGKHFMRTGAEVAGEAAKEEIAGKALAQIKKAFGG